MTVDSEDNIDSRIGMDRSDDNCNAESDSKSDESDSSDSSFERELERERMFCEGHVLIDQTTDMNGNIFEMMTDEEGQSYLRNI